MKAISYHFKSEHKLIYCSKKKLVRPVIIHEISYDYEGKVKTIVKYKWKKILRERDVEAVKTEIFACKDFYIFCCSFFGRQ